MISNYSAFSTPITTDDQLKVLYINSDTLIFDKKSNFSIFKGEVTLLFKGTTLKTNLIKVSYRKVNNRNIIDKLLIPGRFFAQNIESNHLIIANQAEFINSKSELVLKGNVIIQNQNFILKADKLVYDIALTNLNSQINRKKRLK